MCIFFVCQSQRPLDQEPQAPSQTASKGTALCCPRHSRHHFAHARHSAVQELRQFDSDLRDTEQARDQVQQPDPGHQGKCERVRRKGVVPLSQLLFPARKLGRVCQETNLAPQVCDEAVGLTVLYLGQRK